jgi:hypothetical protein
VVVRFATSSRHHPLSSSLEFVFNSVDFMCYCEPGVRIALSYPEQIVHTRHRTGNPSEDTGKEMQLE